MAISPSFNYNLGRYVIDMADSIGQYRISLYTLMPLARESQPDCPKWDIMESGPAVASLFPDRLTWEEETKVFIVSPKVDKLLVSKVSHWKDEEALQTVDAMLFSGSPNAEELNRIEYLCNRWLQRIQADRQYNHQFANLLSADDD